jgi:hypothetical protein
MKTPAERVRARMRRNRPTVTLPVRPPDDVLEDLNEVAAATYVEDAETLVRHYIARGWRKISRS